MAKKAGKGKERKPKILDLEDLGALIKKAITGK